MELHGLSHLLKNKETSYINSYITERRVTLSNTPLFNVTEHPEGIKCKSKGPPENISKSVFAMFFKTPCTFDAHFLTVA